ncbi:HAD family phosphatase [Methanococcoides sp. SA1]|nr:HAD family phosphatase [Methanococcoides sp. SA1]
MLKALIFDMDGVLVDSMPYHTEALNHVFAEMGFSMDARDVYNMEGSKTVEIVRFLLEKDGIDLLKVDVDGLIHRYREEFARIVELKAFSEILGGLPALKERFMLAVVSGADRNIVQDMINSLYGDIFDVVLSGEDVDNGKPAPDPFLRAADMFGLDATECLVVENAAMGVEAANQAGMFCLAVPTYVSKESLKNADRLVDDHQLLMQFLLGLDHLKKNEVEALRLRCCSVRK